LGVVLDNENVFELVVALEGSIFLCLACTETERPECEPLVGVTSGPADLEMRVLVDHPIHHSVALLGLGAREFGSMVEQVGEGCLVPEGLAELDAVLTPSRRVVDHVDVHLDLVLLALTVLLLQLLPTLVAEHLFPINKAQLLVILFTLVLKLEILDFSGGLRGEPPAER